MGALVCPFEQGLGDSHLHTEDSELLSLLDELGKPTTPDATTGVGQCKEGLGGGLAANLASAMPFSCSPGPFEAGSDSHPGAGLSLLDFQSRAILQSCQPSPFNADVQGQPAAAFNGGAWRCAGMLQHAAGLVEQSQLWTSPFHSSGTVSPPLDSQILRGVPIAGQGVAPGSSVVSPLSCPMDFSSRYPQAAIM